MTSYYDVLGVTVDADVEELRRAYLRKAQRLHPDRHAASPEPERRRAEAEMKTLNEAWSTLRNPEARRRYDAELRLVRPESEPGAGEWPDGWPGDDPEPGEGRRSPLRRTGARLAIVVLLVLGLAGSGVALFTHQSDQSGRWRPTDVAELRAAAVRAGMSAPQADCFVRAITRSYAPSDAIDRSVVQQAIDGCR